MGTCAICVLSLKQLFTFSSFLTSKRLIFVVVRHYGTRHPAHLTPPMYKVCHKKRYGYSRFLA